MGVIQRASWSSRVEDDFRWIFHGLARATGLSSTLNMTNRVKKVGRVYEPKQSSTADFTSICLQLGHVRC